MSGADASPYRRADSPGWPRHDGSPPGADDVYCVSPDPALGDIVSAGTNQSRAGLRPLSWKARRVRLAAAAGVGFLVGLVLAAGLRWLVEVALGMGPVFGSEWGWVLLTSPVVIGAAVVLGSRRRPSCSYVGVEGLATHEGMGSWSRHRVMRFADAEALLAHRGRHLQADGTYSATDIQLIWRDARGAALFEIRCTCDESAELEGDHSLHFADSAERAWTAHRVPIREEELRSEGHTRFDAQEGWIEVAPGEVRLRRHRKEVTFSADDLRSVRVRNGWLEVVPSGPRDGWTHEVLHQFSASGVEDLSVLLALVREHVTGD